MAQHGKVMAGIADQNGAAADSSEFPSWEPGYRWIVAQEGTRQGYAIPVGFHRLKTLQAFYADIWCHRGRTLLRRGSAGARALATHFDAELPLERVVAFNVTAIIDRVWQHFRRNHWSPIERADHYCRYGEWFATQVRNHLEKLVLDPGLNPYFGFNTNCLETLELLRNRGIFTVVDQIDPGAVEEELVLAEIDRWPGWSKSDGRAPRSYWDRLKAEWDLADVVLVNSKWSADALAQQGVRPEKIITVPQAINIAKYRISLPINATGNLKVLWLGNLILRKGIQYLADAARRLQRHNIEFILAGPLGVSDSAVRSFPDNMKILGRVTRDQLSGIYRQAHVFVLPTISDGFAITQLEAMVHGLPVVTTPNCGKVVTDGVDGFIVPARDSQALAAALAKLNDDRALLRVMSSHCLMTARKYDLPSNAQLINRAVYRVRDGKPKHDLTAYARVK
jgi:glycosyltransferase involved in cell wall biosynthesis